MSLGIVEINLKETQLAHMGLPFAISFGPKEPLKNILKTMQTNSTGSVLVQDEQKLLGLFTERDYLTAIVGKDIDLNDAIEKHMVANPITIQEENTLEQALQLMVRKDIRHLPIVEKNQKAHKIISVRDVIDFLSEFFPEDIFNLPPNLTQNPQRQEGG